MDLKRKRGDNWTRQEKELFINIMRHSSSIIENKNTDTDANKQKLLEWQKIERKFRQLSGTSRQISQLKGVWRRMKMTAKKNVSQNLNPSEEDRTIMEICSNMEKNANDPISVKYEQQSEQESVDSVCDESLSDKEDVTEEALTIPTDSEVLTVDNPPNVVPRNDNIKILLNAPKIQKQKFFGKKERFRRIKTSHKTLSDSNLLIKEQSLKLLQAEYDLKLKYQRRELQYQKEKHKIELQILMLEKEKKELEIAALKKIY
ncbi:LOW QUALITY PROTEIN: uncharacterized protein LOC113513454 [Galleria mellonella]|uniref:Regulatory protein zeste n=1 Tax=Galleria mellonella TaxID=7137 RepID=A0A6J1WGP0_GALME|nr:LOW QUALITY PROTEIN: uncharacterized protein LOC113513454 [Galleria mellonella]